MAVEELHKVVTLFCPLEKLECLGTVHALSEESYPVWRKYATRKQCSESLDDGNQTPDLSHTLRLLLPF